MGKKIIISGNKSFGLGEHLFRAFGHARFCSRSSGYDFSDPENRSRFAKESLDYDVYIACSAMTGFLQIQLINDVYHTWREARKTGHVIAIGSTIDMTSKQMQRIYGTEKRALKDHCRALSLMVHNPPHIRITHLSVGLLDTRQQAEKRPSENRLGCEYVTDVLRWIIEQPENYSLNQISLDPIQDIAQPTVDG